MQERQSQSVTARDEEPDHSRPRIEPHHFEDCVQLIFLNRFFYPDHSATSQILSDVAFALAATSERVIVITSRQQYDAPGVRFPARETTNGVEVFRVWTSHFGRTNLVGRSVDYLTFYLSAAFVLLRLARRGDGSIS
jgi:colanic acid biosynthesis glycosyl transferase WcaI